MFRMGIFERFVNSTILTTIWFFIKPETVIAFAVGSYGFQLIDYLIAKYRGIV